MKDIHKMLAEMASRSENKGFGFVILDAYLKF
jgi:hypothetical protein